FNGPNGHHQFVQITARGNKDWKADMTLLDGGGKTVYTWHVAVPNSVDSQQTWWYTIGSGHVEGMITQHPDGTDPILTPFAYTADDADGHCISITANVQFSGDTNSGTCNPS